MTDQEMPTPCATVADSLAELSLGSLSGRERAVAVEHIETCDRCRAEVEQLTLTADSILRAAPRIEPPLGFEQRLVERMAPREPVRSASASASAGRRRWRTLLSLAAAVLVIGLAVGLGLGWAMGGRTNSPVPQATVVRDTAPLMEGGQVYGRVSTSSGHGTQPAWLSMTVHGAEWTGWVRCQVTVTGGSALTVGRFWLHDGSGQWGSTVPVRADHITGARLVAPTGRTIASASFVS